MRYLWAILSLALLAPAAPACGVGYGFGFGYGACYAPVALVQPFAITYAAPVAYAAPVCATPAYTAPSPCPVPAAASYGVGSYGVGAFGGYGVARARFFGGARVVVAVGHRRGFRGGVRSGRSVVRTRSVVRAR